MGKNTLKNQKKNMAKARKKNAVELNLESMTTTKLLSRAQEEIDVYQFEKAQRYCQEALKRDPDHVAALETSASLCIELGNLDGARHCLGRAITLQPDFGFSKYLSMAQLLEGKESLQCYLKGIELIHTLLEKSQSSPQNENRTGTASEVTNDEDEAELASVFSEQDELRVAVEERENESPCSSSSLDKVESKKFAVMRHMSLAYCSVAELFMTDLCDEEDAESQCHYNISKAIEVDPSNPEAYQNMASFLLVKQEVEQAKEYISKSLELWLPKYKSVDEGEAMPGTFDPVEVCPLSYATRLSTARILIEVEDNDHAMDVLEGLAEEDDSVVDTWYLMGWSSYLRGEDHRNNACYFLHRAKQVHEVIPSSDTKLLEHLEELLIELGPLPEEQGQDGADIDSDFEDSDDDVKEEMETN